MKNYNDNEGIKIADLNNDSSSDIYIELNGKKFVSYGTE